MADVCLGSGQLAAVIFGAILGTIVICAAFIALFWRWIARSQQDAKIFYVDRSEDAKDAEAANAPAASAADMLDGGEKAAIGGSASPVAGAGAELGTQHSLMLRGKGGGASSSATAATSLQPLAPVPVGPPHVLPELGISISKVPRSGFQVRFEVQKRPTARVRSLLKVESVEKRDTSFIAGDRLTAMSLNLDQLKLADAAKLLELLVPYRIQLEVLRVNVETAAPPAAVDDAQAASAASPPLPSPPPPLPSSPPPSLVTDETTNDGGNELSNVATAEAEVHAPQMLSASSAASPPPRSPFDNEAPPLPASQAPPLSSASSSTSVAADETPEAPTSPTQNAADTTNAAESTTTPIDATIAEAASARSSRLTTRIPTPKSVRVPTSRLNAERLALADSAVVVAETPPKPPDHAPRPPNGSVGGVFGRLGVFEKHEALAVSSDETDEFGLTETQYRTLESNRRRLENERQQLRDLGILG